jgi:hypothetical protein
MKKREGGASSGILFALSISPIALPLLLLECEKIVDLRGDAELDQCGGEICAYIL